MDGLNVWICKSCPSTPTFNTLGENALHQKQHINDKNFVFHCPSCSETSFLTYTALDNHICREHSKSRNIPQVVTVSEQCTAVPTCKLRFDSSKLLVHHITQDHLSTVNSTAQCPFRDQCKSKNFFKIAAFRVHMTQKHKGWNLSKHNINNTFLLGSHTPEATLPMDIEIPPPEDEVPRPDSADEDTSMHESMHEQEQYCSEYDDLLDMQKDLYHRLAIFYMKLEAEHFVPVSTIQVIARGLAQLTEDSLKIVKMTAKRELEFLNVPEELRDSAIRNIISSDCLYAAHHKDSFGPKMITNALRKSYYKKHFKFIRPLEINLSKDANNPRCTYYVPVKKSLKLQLSKPEVQEEILKSFSRPASEDDILRDYQDGSLYKRLVLKEPGTKCIDLIIFQDGFTGTKDLSSVANDNGILGMYMCIANLSRELRSKVDCIQLIMLIPDFKTMFSDFKMKCFTTVVNTLRKLEKDGITFMGETVGVRLVYIVGDNKGQHELGGFIQCFSSDYFCRFCPMTRPEILLEPWKVGPLRTAEQYEDASISVPPDRATFMGVSGPDFLCPFNKLENFHVCDPRLAPCVAHDVYEGVIDLDLSQIIQILVKEKKWFSYELLNRRIRRFPYKDQDMRNKPAPVRFDKNKKTIIVPDPKLGGYAIQNLTLCRLLPFILGEDLIQDTSNEHWQLYLSLKQIVDLICAPSISLNQLSYLKILLEDYADKRKGLLDDGKCKHHYIQHYPDLIEIMGPVILLMTLRFESFHQFFKRAIKSGNNFINLGVSLAKKYCMYLSYLSTGSLFSKGVKLLEEGTDFATFVVNSEDDTIINLLQETNLNPKCSIMTKIEIAGLLYQAGKWILLRNLSDVTLVVGLVQHIVHDGKSVAIIFEEYQANYLKNVGIYAIAEKIEVTIWPITRIKNPMPISVYDWGDYEYCFSLKYTIAE